MMKGKNARKLVVDSNLRDGELSKTVKIASLSKSERQAIIDKFPGSDDAKIAAAIEIQRAFRGYCTRCRLLNVVDPIASCTAVYSSSKHHLSRLNDVRTPSPTKISSQLFQNKGREKLEQNYLTYLEEEAVKNGDDPATVAPMRFEDFCTNKIRDWWVAKNEKKAKLKARKKKQQSPLMATEAATKIQRGWRRHIDVQVFRYYRDLINFKQRGDPAMMLRCINPQEAKMLDAAAGIHIKFRLAGDKFPPNIYYKIFTHRSVQDLCANSPKDYTRPGAKRKMARDVHNKGDRANYRDKSGWYERSENNGWRLVSDRLIHHIMSDPVTWDTSHKKVDFHHNKLRRKQDIEKKKKLKKIDWMKKMYKQGMLKAKADDPDTVDLIEGAAAGMIATVDRHGPDAVQDWEVDELLDWTTSLNFDDYWTGWKEIATSSQSEKAIADRMKLVTSVADPFEVQVTTSHHHDGSTRPSFNTPESSLTSANHHRH